MVFFSATSSSFFYLHILLCLPSPFFCFSSSSNLFLLFLYSPSSSSSLVFHVIVSSSFSLRLPHYLIKVGYSFGIAIKLTVRNFIFLKFSFDVLPHSSHSRNRIILSTFLLFHFLSRSSLSSYRPSLSSSFFFFFLIHFSNGKSHCNLIENETVRLTKTEIENMKLQNSTIIFSIFCF